MSDCALVGEGANKVHLSLTMKTNTTMFACCTGGHFIWTII